MTGLDDAKILACVALMWVVLRSVRVCTGVFLAVNIDVLRVAAVQVCAKGANATGRAGRRERHQDETRRRDSKYIAEYKVYSSQVDLHLRRHTTPTNSSQHQHHSATTLPSASIYFHFTTTIQGF
jgi:hypothetical protein